MFKLTVNRWSQALGMSLIALTACTQSPQQVPPSAGSGGSLRTQAVAYSFYASPSGGGSTCSSGAPCSLTGARDKVRTVNGGMNGDVVVNLSGGTYALASTLQFTQSDSGYNGNNVIWQAASGATPVVSGGQQITGWSLFDSGKNIYRASVGSLRFRQLYVSGARAIRARAPNRTDETNYGPFYSASGSVAPYSVNAAQVGNWQRLNQVEFVWADHWIHKRARIASFNVSGSSASVQFQLPERNSPMLTSASSPNPGFFFENAYELLDAEGEWYLNTSDNYLYYKPRAGESMSSVQVIAPRIERLMTLTGTGSDPIKNLQFKGITFSHDNWLLPNTAGFLDIQASSAIDDGTTSPTVHYSDVPGMIEVTYSQNIRFERNRIEKSGAHGLNFLGKTNGDSVIGNTFTDTSANALNMACDQFTTPVTLCSNDLISNNVIENYGRDYTGSVGMRLVHMTYANVVHNEVRNGFYSGISIGWNWSGDDLGANYNQVQYNKIHDVMRLHDDGGPLYSLGRMIGARFHHNHMFNTNNSSAGVYLDNGSSEKTVDFNVIDSPSTWAFYANNDPNYNNRIQNNFYNGSFGLVSGLNPTSNNTNAVSSQAALEIAKCTGIEAVWGGSISSACPSGGDTVPPTPPVSGGISGFKKLINKKWGTALHNTGNSYNNGAGVYNVVSTPASWNLDEQVWQITDAGAGYYKLVNKKWSTALHNTGDLYDNGADVYNTAATPSSWNLDEQLWQFTDAGGGYYKLVNKKWGTALHNTGNLYNNGAGVYSVVATPTSWNLDEQLWQLVAP